MQHGEVHSLPDCPDKAITPLIGKYTNDGPCNIARDHVARGEADTAFGWLDKAAR